MADLNLTSTVTMNDGNEIPQYGFGVFDINERELCENAVLTALDAGYRHIDTAHVYKNEHWVGNAVEQSDVPREDIFITTKNVFDHNPDRIREVFKESQDKLQTDYLDLFLIHWPLNDEGLPGAWDCLCQMKEEGLIKSAGVSNITVKRFEVLLKQNKTFPAVNQIQMHVYYQRPDLVEYCAKNNIVIEAWSPLARGLKFDDPGQPLIDIAEKHGKSVPQIMIRFILEMGHVCLVKSQTPARIKQNTEIFDFQLDEEDMAALKAMDEDNDVLGWTPKGYY